LSPPHALTTVRRHASKTSASRAYIQLLFAICALLLSALTHAADNPSFDRISASQQDYLRVSLLPAFDRQLTEQDFAVAIESLAQECPDLLGVPRSMSCYRGSATGEMRASASPAPLSLR
jgi:hypothetical protein